MSTEQLAMRFARRTKDDLLAVLQQCIGRDKGLSAAHLAGRLGLPLASGPRLVRELVTELRTDGIAVCGHPATGYFIASNREELEETCQFLRSRAMHSLVLEAKLRGLPLADLVGQLRLKT
jgi:hypothetical protein